MREFTVYFNSFYGLNGLYPIKDISQKQIEAAILKLSKDHIFEGDSIDREVLRDIIFTDDELIKAYR